VVYEINDDEADVACITHGRFRGKIPLEKLDLSLSGRNID
jgi:hypothetical protein